MYAYKKENNEEGKACNGTKKAVIKKDIHFENNKETLFNSQQMHHTMKTIRSDKHQLGSCMKLIKYHYPALTTRDIFMTMESLVMLMDIT